MFRNNILEMEEYKPPLEGRLGHLLLDFNERTTPPSTRVRRLCQEYSANVAMNTYPEYGDLDETIGNYAGVKKGQVLFTNGSDQGIDVVFRAIVDRGDKVIIPSPSFAMFYQIARVQDASILRPRYQGEDLIFPLEEVLDSIGKDTRLAIVCNPNNPTGTAVQRKQMERIVQRAKEFDTALLVDEAYFEFNPGITVRELIESYDNLFISRTFSKAIGIAALRAGYVLSQEKNISQLKKIRGPYDCNMEAVAVLRSLRYDDTVEDMREYVKEVMEKAKPRTEQFLKSKGVRTCPSGANFVLADPSPLSSKEIADFLKNYATPHYKGILVRTRDDPPNTFRLSIGTNENMDLFMEAFSRFLESKVRT